jgi:RIO kinase 1
VEWASKTQERLRLRQARYETTRLMREKRSEELEALEQVFDKSTLMVIYHMLDTGKLAKISGAVRSGKEAKIYWGLGPKKKEIAIKIYLTLSAEFKKGRLAYIEGDPRFQRVRTDTRSLVYTWAMKEFKNLKQARDAGVRVPNPIAVQKNVLLMAFIGKSGEPAPLLRETVLKNPQSTYRELVYFLRLLYRKAELVHGDFSEYNIMIWRGKPVLFDVSQAVATEHPMADRLLMRDILNLNKYFDQIGVRTEAENKIHDQVVGTSVDKN